MSAYLSLFFIAFLAATIFPAQSELALVALAASGNYSLPTLLAVASLGNIAGSTINWALGRYALHYQHHRWFPIKPKQMKKFEMQYRKFGRWSLLASWVPIIGDPLTVIAGVLKEPLWSFLIIVAIAKISRYLFVTGLLQMFY